MQSFTRYQPISFSGITQDFNEVPVYFSFKEQLITKIHEHIESKYYQIAIQHVANTTHYLTINKLKPPNRKALLFNIAMTLLGYVHGQEDSTLLLAYQVMEFIENAKQRQIERSSSTISTRTATT